jgi:hypothetical protein
MQQSREGYPRLGLIPFKGDDPSHYRGDAPIKVELTEEGLSAFDTTNKTRTVIYFGGPAAVSGEPIADTDVKVLAKYAGRIINTRQPSPVEVMLARRVNGMRYDGRSRLESVADAADCFNVLGP